MSNNQISNLVQKIDSVLHGLSDVQQFLESAPVFKVPSRCKVISDSTTVKPNREGWIVGILPKTDLSGFTVSILFDDSPAPIWYDSTKLVDTLQILELSKEQIDSQDFGKPTDGLPFPRGFSGKTSMQPLNASCESFIERLTDQHDAAELAGNAPEPSWITLLNRLIVSDPDTVETFLRELPEFT